MASDPPIFRVALIDLTTSQIVISIGEPPVADDVVDRPFPSAVAPCAEPVLRGCARGLLRRRMAQTRARHLGDGPTWR